MPISPDHAAHIGRVEVAYVLTGPELDPDAVSRTLGLAADFAVHVGDARITGAGCVLGVEREGVWRLESRQRVQGDALTRKDIDVHVRALLAILRPHVATLRALAERGEAAFDVLWESSYLHAGTGPVLAADCIEGIARLGASLGFDIVAIDDASP